MFIEKRVITLKCSYSSAYELPLDSKANVSLILGCESKSLSPPRRVKGKTNLPRKNKFLGAILIEIFKTYRKKELCFFDVSSNLIIFKISYRQKHIFNLILHIV